MVNKKSLDPHGSLWALIAVHLRVQREQRGMSGSALADLLKVNRSTVSRLEAGIIRLSERHAMVLDRYWATGGVFLALVTAAKSRHDSEWFKQHTEKEARASRLRLWELSWIPGLFQTGNYAKSQFHAAGLHDIDSNVTIRMSRQRVLSRNPPPTIFALLDQGAIEQPVGGPEVMREQLARLLELAALPNITIRIVPRSAGAHVGRDGSFELITVDGTDSAYVEATVAGRLVTDPGEVDSFQVLYDRIGSVALPVGPSLDLIKETMETLR